MVVAIAFVPDDTDVSMPPWAPDLPELGAIDSGQLTPADVTQSTLAGDSAPESVPADVPSNTEG